MKISDMEMRCNVCDASIYCNEKSLDLLEHIKDQHKEVYDLHKENPEATVGFRIEFLNLHVLKDEDSKTQPVIIGEVCDASTEDAKPEIEKILPNLSSQIIVTPVKKKGVKRESETRRKSWVWKYFDRMSNHIFRCSLCEAVLSIKGCNTNNMNRHVRTKHPAIYTAELTEKKVAEVEGNPSECELPSEEIPQFDKGTNEKSHKQLNRRSWIWTYFDRITRTLAQCKLCKRNICHGGNATGNMNRHLKMIHNITRPSNHDWIWKVFDRTDDDYYVCRICQYKLKFVDSEKDTSYILYHLRLDHGVVSGEQIITSTECEEEEVLD